MSFFKKWFRQPEKQSGKQNPEPVCAPAHPAGNVEYILGQAKNLQLEQGKEAAINWLEQQAFETGNDSRPLIRLCELYIENGQMEQAEEILDVARMQYPDDPACLVSSGKIAVLLKKGKEAEQYYRKLLELMPDSTEAGMGIVRALHLQEKFAESLPVCEDILEKLHVHENADRDSRAPKIEKEFFPQYILTLYYVGDYAKALEYIDFCKREMNGNISFDVIEYICCFFIGKLEKAESLLDRLLRKNPSDASLHYGRAILRLIQHDFSRGWPEYRYRIRNEPKFFRPLPFPEWKGSPLKDKKIVVALEQGLGDQIMFASCLPDLLQQAPATVYLETHARLAPLFQRSFPAARIIPTQQNQSFDWLEHAADADCYVQLGELPGFFRTDIGQFPHHEGYLVANPAYRTAWQQRLQSHQTALKVGFCWKGGVEKTRSHVRSMTPEQLAPLFALPGITWVNLQFGTTEAEVERLPALAEGSNLVLPEQVGQDMDELAAIIDSLDMVVTVCNTVVHVAGALGKTAFVLTPYLPEWRYGMKDWMPWYPGVRLFRQTDGDNTWDEVLEQVRLALLPKLDESVKFSTTNKLAAVLQ